MIDFGSITNSVVGDNHVHASSPTGTAFGAAGAIVVDEPGLTLRSSELSGNTVDANAASGLRAAASSTGRSRMALPAGR